MKPPIKSSKKAIQLGKEEMEGLIPNISTRVELDKLEGENIIKGEIWAWKKSNPDLLNFKFCSKLHKKMFGEVWKWAGEFRPTDTNIGCDHFQIRTELCTLFKDTQYWIKNKTYGWIELATRFHHKLVWIHPFLNGNGRHARLMTNLLLNTHKQEKFTWGKNSKLKPNQIRNLYIDALKKADDRNFEDLIKFVKT